MIKELLKYLLPLCILLVDGYSNMYAGSQERQSCNSPIQILTQSEHPNFVQAFDDNEPAFRLPDAARKFSEFIRTISEEKEEDSTEWFSVKKSPRAGGMPAATFASRQFFPFCYISKTRPLPRSSSFYSSRQYLRLRVLRI
ncbi:hypothetical protein GCM10007423_12470 [Dyadobacter endophyticus]|uniref:Uncharacterized protein n=1 Tax=Dyadobacter endophyticus TaxID=1749036 RepID=A0ABQ1YI27_9BACT|nr:hypothetical protein [Dyadobacter endophyticus]GGH27037.1 hypothetical protein GCM10007423_12470 [Dyadobacter endophyticus]